MARTIPHPEGVLCRAAELRLRRHADFQRVYAAAKKQHGKQMSFFAAGRAVAESGYAGPRVGLTVGKVMGKAHVRNRIKRRLRESVRAEQAALGGLAVDVVLHPRKAVETLPFAELRAEVAGVFRRVSRAIESSEAAHTLEGVSREGASIPMESQPGRKGRGEGGARAGRRPDAAADRRT